MHSRARTRHHLLALLGVALACATGVRAQERLLVRVLDEGPEVRIALLDGQVVRADAATPSGPRPLPRPLPGDLLAGDDRVVWLIAEDRKTRITYMEGVEVDRRTWDRATDRALGPERHLRLPPALRGLDQGPPPFAPEGAAPGTPLEGAGEVPEDAPATGEAFVGAAVPATDLFGETLGGLLPAPEERPEPLSFSGYVEQLLMGGEDGPSAHVLDTGLAGNRALEAKEVVLNLDAGLGDRTRFFGQIRARRFNSFDMRIAMLQLGDPSGPHWRIGRQVHPFGTFPLRNLSDRNPLYGYPLAYFYRTALRADMAPTSPAALLAGRGQGAGGAGMAIGGPGLYQTYILRSRPVGDSGKWTVTYGLSNGAISATENVTRNDAFGLIGNVRFQPNPAFRVGFSGSAAPYLSSGAPGLPPGEEAEDLNQRVQGLDLRYDRGKLRLDAEALWTGWEVPAASGLPELKAFSWYLEGVWTLRPKLYFAWRYSEMEFDDVPDGAGGTTPWDFDTDRIEVGLGYRPTRALLAKLSAQHNETDVNPDPDDDALVLQLIGSF